MVRTRLPAATGVRKTGGMAHTTQCGTVTPVSIKHQLEQVEDETAAAATMTVSERVDALPITQAADP